MGRSGRAEPLSEAEISALGQMAYYGRNWLIGHAEHNEDAMRISEEKIEEQRKAFRRAERKRRRDAKREEAS